GELVPLGGFLIVLRHAEPVGVELAEQRHRLRIGLVVDALGGERKRGDVMAALERAEGEIGLAAVRGGSGCGIVCCGWRRLLLWFCRRRARLRFWILRGGGEGHERRERREREHGRK